MRPFDWPPQAACRDVGDHKYKPLIGAQCGLYLRSPSLRPSARSARRPNRTALRSSSVTFVPPVRPFPPSPPSARP